MADTSFKNSNYFLLNNKKKTIHAYVSASAIEMQPLPLTLRLQYFT